MKNKTILITGGATGIGKAIAQKFLSENHHVIVFDIKEPDYTCEFHNVDISNEDQLAKAFSKIESLDILVNNAGIYFHQHVHETEKQDLEKLFSINVLGSFLVSKFALPLLKKTKGNIINISSVLGSTPEPSSPAYCASKAAINMLTKCMAMDYAKDNIRVNAIAPGPIKTPLFDNALSGNNISDSEEKVPLKRVGAPSEVADLVYYLSSEKASFITGSIFPIDGGESATSCYT